MPLLKPVIVWCLLLAVVCFTGTLRDAVLVPLVGLRRARQLSLLITGLLLAATVAAVLPWLHFTRPAQALAVAGIWFALTAVFRSVAKLCDLTDWRATSIDAQP